MSQLNPQLAAAFASIAAGMGIPMPAVQKLESGNPRSAWGSAGRAMPPKSLPQSPQPGIANGLTGGTGVLPPPGPPQAPAPPQQANLPPAGPPGPPPAPAQPDYAAQMSALLPQMQTGPVMPPQLPKFQDPNKGFLLGEALSAIVAPQTIGVVGQALSYDQYEREQDYGRKYQAAMDSWRARADSMQAQNQGLMDKAEILKAQAALPASLAADRTVAIPDPAKLSKMSPYEQDREMSEYYAKVAAARLAAGATQPQVKEATDMANTYRQQEAQDRMIAIQEGKMAAPPGTRLPDGTIVQPGDMAATLYYTAQAKLKFEQARVAFEKGTVARADKALQLRAAAIANTAGFHADEINARYNINAADRDTRMTIALLGIANGNAKMTQQQQWQVGKDVYDKQMAEYKAYADAQAKGQDTSGFTQTTQPAPPAAPNVNVNVNLPSTTTPTDTGKPPAVAPPPAPTDQQLTTAIASPRVAALDPQTRQLVLAAAHNKGATYKSVVNGFGQIATGKAKSNMVTQHQAVQILNALVGK